MTVQDYVSKLEHNLMLGSGRWVADFIESFRDYRVEGKSFDMVITGGMRVKGFVVSKFIAWLTTPDYRVACFVNSRDTDPTDLSSSLRAIRKFMDEKELDWSWLVILREGSFSTAMRQRVENDDRKEIGIALVDLESQNIVSSRSYVGRRMVRFIRCFK